MNPRTTKPDSLAIVTSAIAVALPVLAIASATLAGIAHMKGWGSKAVDGFVFIWAVCGLVCLPMALVALTLSIRRLLRTGRRITFGVLSLFDALAAAVGIWIYMIFDF